MKAKIILNEIKQDIKGSGLSAIKVGHSAMTGAFDGLSKIVNNVHSFADLTKKIGTHLRNLDSFIPDLLNESPENIIQLPEYSIRRTKVDEYLKHEVFKSSPDIEYLGRRISYFDSKIKHFSEIPCKIAVNRKMGAVWLKYQDQGEETYVFFVRKPRYINEIKQETNKSALGSIGVGKARLTRFYDKIVERWPETLFSLFNITHNTSYYMVSMAEKVANILNCDANDICYKSKTGFGQDDELDIYAEHLAKISNEEPIVINDTDYVSYSDEPVKVRITITPVTEWDFAIVMKQTYYKDNTIKTINYLIKKPK